MFAMVGGFRQQRLVGWIPTPQSEELDLVSSKMDLASRESMRPVGRQCEAIPEYIHPRGVVASSQEDHRAFWFSAQIQLKALGEGATSGRMISAPYAAHPMRNHVGRRQAL